MSELELLVNGTRYGGWKRIRVTHGMEQLCDSFSVAYSERWEGNPEGSPIHRGDAVQALIDGEVAITGYVDGLQESYDGNSHELSVQGRSKTRELVDCSAVPPPGSWRDRTVLQIAQALCKPFGLNATADDPGPALRRHKVEMGESVHQCLERAARMRGLLLMSTADGNLKLARASTQSVSSALVFGENIRAASKQDSEADRYSEYLARGQSSGDDNWHGRKAAAGAQSVKDGGVRRHRPLIVSAEGQAEKLKQRAKWERAVRLGRGFRCSYTVMEWRANDELWWPNLRVPVSDPVFRLDRDMLIVGVQRISDDEGERTRLDVTFPEAFSEQEPPE